MPTWSPPPPVVLSEPALAPVQPLPSIVRDEEDEGGNYFMEEEDDTATAASKAAARARGQSSVAAAAAAASGGAPGGTLVRLPSVHGALVMDSPHLGGGLSGGPAASLPGAATGALRFLQAQASPPLGGLPSADGHHPLQHTPLSIQTQAIARAPLAPYATASPRASALPSHLPTIAVRSASSSALALQHQAAVAPGSSRGTAASGIAGSEQSRVPLLRRESTVNVTVAAYPPPSHDPLSAAAAVPGIASRASPAASSRPPVPGDTHRSVALAGAGTGLIAATTSSPPASNSSMFHASPPQPAVLTPGGLATNPHLPFFQQYRGGLRAAIVEGPGIYYCGIIDILQRYTWSKWLERQFKVYFLWQNGKGLSAMNPDSYAARFRTRVIAQLVDGYTYQDYAWDEEFAM